MFGKYLLEELEHGLSSVYYRDPKYWDLQKKGLKKQANSFLFAFVKSFQENVSEADADAILFQFCREYIDEMKFSGDSLPRRCMPFQITRLLDNYLNHECEKNQMPQMR